MDTFNGIPNNLYVSFTSQTNPDCTFFSLRHLLLSALLLICLIFYILDFFLRGMWRFLHFYYLPSHNLTIFWRALLYRNCSCYIFTLLLFIYIHSFHSVFSFSPCWESNMCRRKENQQTDPLSNNDKPVVPWEDEWCDREGDVGLFVNEICWVFCFWFTFSRRWEPDNQQLGKAPEISNVVRLLV